VWPFQWRIAVSWMCSYFTVQILIPILFALRGPLEAGQVGMSLSIAGYMSVLALAWTSTKATPFGSLIARREFKTLAQLFRRAVVQSMVVFAAIVLLALAAVALLPTAAPRLAARMVPVSLFALLLLGAAANHFTQNLGILLRSFKQEPFLGQSLVVAALNIGLAAAVIPKFGAFGAALSYLVATAGAGLPIAWIVYRRAQRGYLNVTRLVNLPQPCKGA
jgi:O-antigen/teichoic acid export membrane protein